MTQVKRWYQNVARGSKITADVYLQRPGVFCTGRNISIRELAEMNEQDTTNLLMDAVSDMEEHGYARSYVESNVKAVKS
ncbi:MAG: hypothetical protein ACUVTM_04035 [Candidatus Bathyarchaeia archaeon]